MCNQLVRVGFNLINLPKTINAVPSTAAPVDFVSSHTVRYASGTHRAPSAAQNYNNNINKQNNKTFYYT